MVIKSSEKELYKPIFTADKETLEAEVKKGTVVGQLHLEKTEGTDYGYVVDQAAEVDVVTTEAVERSSWISLMFQAIGNFFGSVWNSTTDFVEDYFSSENTGAHIESAVFFVISQVFMRLVMASFIFSTSIPPNPKTILGYVAISSSPVTYS